MRLSVLLLAGLFLPSCGQAQDHVIGPFYLMTPEMRIDTALFRCLDSSGCARDNLPGATVFAAGGDDHYVVLARHPRGGELGSEETDRSVTEYFYFRRTPYETKGWGEHPELIVGPLTHDQFLADTRRLGLPELSVKLDDLD